MAESIVLRGLVLVLPFEGHRVRATCGCEYGGVEIIVTGGGPLKMRRFAKSITDT